jgi:hypothetical protein
VSAAGRVARWAAGAAGLVVGGYAGCAGLVWWRYGHVKAAAPEERDHLLDRYMPEYDVAERHHTRVHGPADAVLAAAGELDLEESIVARVIFRARELVLGAEAPRAAQPRGLMSQVTALGWRVLETVPGGEIVVGAVTQPWLANVVFRGLPADEFAAFAEPGYAKIAWTLRADPDGPAASVFRTETRVVTTDNESRSKFRWYWARFSPGIILIRHMLLRSLRRRFA